MSFQSELIRQINATERQVDMLPRPELSADLISPFQALTGLRGFWPMSAMRDNGNTIDQSGLILTLTYAGNPAYGYDNLAPYIQFDGTGDWLTRADQAALDISGTETTVVAAVRGATLGGWFYVEETGTDEGLITKDDNANQRSYGVYFNQFDRFICLFSDDGTNFASVDNPDGPGSVPSLDAWYFVVARFDPGVSADLFVNGFWTTVATARANIFNSTSDLKIGALHGNIWPFQGRASLCFLCAAYLSDAIISSLYEQTKSAFRI
jgi:hypothetical protein